MHPTEVMTLGGLGGRALGYTGPQWRTNFLSPPRTSPMVPQNLLRQTVNGLGQLSVRTPGISPAAAAFRTPGLQPGEASLFGLSRGLGRAKRIAFGQVAENVDDMVTSQVDSAMADFDAARNTGMETAVPMVETPMAPDDAPAVAAELVNGNNGANTAAQATLIGWGTVSGISALASLYHGYRRNQRKGTGPALGWGLLWFFMGATFPLVTPVVGVAQGWAKPKGR